MIFHPRQWYEGIIEACSISFNCTRMPLIIGCLSITLVQFTNKLHKEEMESRKYFNQKIGPKFNKSMEAKTFEQESKAILKGLEIAYEKMVKLKKEKGTPLVVSEDGEIKLIPAEEIVPTTVYKR